MAEPLYRWLLKYVNPTYHNPPEEHRNAFEALKQSLVEPPVLALPVSNKSFLLYTDYSSYNICVTFLQR